MSKLIRGYQSLTYDQRLITEAVKAGTIPRVKCILQRANSQNQNGRIYPRNILMREAQKYQNDFVARRAAMGELDHPESSVVNLRNVSHNVVEMHWEGDDLVGEIEILSTPSGNIVKELMKSGIQLGVSSRGLGSVINIGENSVEVDEDFNLICFDIVSNPSTQGAYLFENVQQSLAKAKEDRLNNLIANLFSELTDPVNRR